MGKFAGQELELILETKDEDSNLDYVFLHDPIIRQKKSSPKRVIWVFIDTLRKSNLSMYGYERQTTPKLDAWAEKQAGIYSQARSDSSWTLPSSRTMVTGHHPEEVGKVTTIQQILASKDGIQLFSLEIFIYRVITGDIPTGHPHRCINWPLAGSKLKSRTNPKRTCRS